MTTEPQPGRQRRERSDKGQVRITERDLMVFEWLTSMKAVYEPDMGVLIARATGQPLIGEPALRALTRRWSAAGLADARKLIARRPRIVRLLPGGARIVGQEHYQATAEFTTYHQAETARVRLHMEGNPSKTHGRVVAWESEREFRQHSAELFGNAKQLPHVPDGVATFEDGHRAAVEVERSPKSQERLRTILSRILTTYPTVIYAVPADPRELQRTGKLVPLPEIKTAVTTAEAAVRQQAQRSARLGDLRVIPIPEEVKP